MPRMGTVVRKRVNDERLWVATRRSAKQLAPREGRCQSKAAGHAEKKGARWWKRPWSKGERRAVEGEGEGAGDRRIPFR